MKSWIQALSRTRQAIAGVLTRILPGGRADAATLEELEETLIRADVPARLAAELVGSVERGSRTVSASRRLEDLLVETMGESRPFEWRRASEPSVILIVGVNGAGKTTTAAKLAALAAARGLRPMLAAADTYRAAGSDQLKIWADRIGCACVGGLQGSDSAAVAFDAVKAAVARGCGVVFVDTAGRMHTRQPLMQELQKVHRTLGKSLPGAPHETWIVLDATVGNNAIQQARTFGEAVPLTGAIVTKLDGSAKAGFVPALRRELNVPVLFAGLGEAVEDLVPFEARAFAQALVGSNGEQP